MFSGLFGCHISKPGFSGTGGPGAGLFQTGLWFFILGAFLMAPAEGGQDLSCATTRFDHIATARYIHDGDTLFLSGGAKVRIIGLNAPEIAYKEKPGEPLGKEAREHLREKIRALELGLVFDEEQRDPYGRLLAHVFLRSGENLAVWLIQQGLAQAVIIPPNLKFAACYQDAEDRARAQGRGLWAHRYFAARNATRVRKSGFMRVIGCVRRVSESRKGFFLDMAAGFALYVPENAVWYGDTALSKVGLMRAYLGRKVIAKGWVYRKGQKKHLMKILHPNAVETVTEGGCQNSYFP